MHSLKEFLSGPVQASENTKLQIITMYIDAVPLHYRNKSKMYVSQLNKIYATILHLDFLCKIEKNNIQILNMENQKGWH